MTIGTVDRARPQKLYYQLLEILKDPIERGEWKVGMQIPTEEQICSQYRVSKATVRSAIEELVALGYLKKLQGIGTFVRRLIPDDSIRMAIHLNTERMEYSAVQRYRVIEGRKVQPGVEIGDYLNLGAAEDCWHLARVLALDDMPLELEDLYIPSRLCVGDLGQRGATVPLSSCVEARCSVKICRLREKTDICSAGEQEAALLRIPSRTPALRIRQFFYRAGDQAVAFASTIRRIDRFGRVLEFERL